MFSCLHKLIVNKMSKDATQKYWQIEFVRLRESYEGAFDLEDFLVNFFTFEYKHIMSNIWKFLYSSSALYSMWIFYKLDTKYARIRQVYIQTLVIEVRHYLDQIGDSVQTLRLAEEQLGVQHYLLPFVALEFRSLRNAVLEADIKAAYSADPVESAEHV